MTVVCPVAVGQYGATHGHCRIGNRTARVVYASSGSRLRPSARRQGKVFTGTAGGAVAGAQQHKGWIYAPTLCCMERGGHSQYTRTDLQTDDERDACRIRQLYST